MHAPNPLPASGARLGMFVLACALGGSMACQGGAIDGTAGARGDDLGAGGADGSSAPFALARETPKLLPFDVRLAKVAAVVGVSVDDPLLDLIRANHIALGDYDYANGVLPDLTWTPSRMALWVRSLRPVCQSGAFQVRYPELPEGAAALITAAHGRAATVDDLASIDQGVDDPALDDGERYEVACLSVLSSAEMVLQ